MIYEIKDRDKTVTFGVDLVHTYEDKYYLSLKIHDGYHHSQLNFFNDAAIEFADLLKEYAEKIKVKPHIPEPNLKPIDTQEPEIPEDEEEEESPPKKSFLKSMKDTFC